LASPVLNKRQLRSSHTPVRPPHDQVKKIFGDREAEAFLSLPK